MLLLLLLNSQRPLHSCHPTNDKQEGQALERFNRASSILTLLHRHPTRMVHSVWLPQFLRVQINNLEQTSTGSVKHGH